jgi:hypothetical protein
MKLADSESFESREMTLAEAFVKAFVKAFAMASVVEASAMAVNQHMEFLY